LLRNATIGARRARRRAAGLAAITCALAAAPVGAQIAPWTPPAGSSGATGGIGAPVVGASGSAPGTPWTAAVLVQLTGTDNVNLSPSNAADGGLVTEITPSLAVNWKGNRTTLVGDVSLPVVLYLPSGVASDRVFPSVNLLGDVALVKNLFYVEGAINVSQQFFNPFGAQPVSVTNQTQNRYRSDAYRISPFIRGTTLQNTYYELRYDNVWTNLSGAPVNTNNSYYQTWSGVASNTQATLGWSLSGNYTDIDFNNQSPITQQLYRARPLYNINQIWQVSASVGYERNEFTATESSGPIYGVGFIWRPSQRTNVVGDWEHRFFGSSYQFSFDHATPLSVWSVQASRSITSYPQQFATVPGGVNIAAFLNNLFVLRVPDATERAQLIAAFIADRGLPQSTSGAVNLYTEQILLQQSASGSMGLVGARNSVFVNVFYVKSEPITATGQVLPPLFVTGNNNTQIGGSAVWSRQLTPSLTFLASVDGVETRGNGASIAETRQGTLRLGLSRPLTANTTGFVGARYQTLTSNVAPEFNEVAAFVGLTHSFR
jgi:uncharacterized protein (PEP-CTERM system associated)